MSEAAIDELARLRAELAQARQERDALRAQAERTGSERVRLAADANAQRRLLERIIAHAPVMLGFVDRDLVYRWCNPLYSAMAGRPAAALIGSPIAEALGGALGREAAARYAQVLAAREPVAMTLAVTVPGHAEPRQLDVRYVPIADEAGQPEGVLVLASDVTQRVAHERLQASHIQMLQDADRYKDEFLDVISHELRTPLNFIMGFASILEDEVYAPLNEGQARAVGRIMYGADRMHRLVEDLLVFAKLRAGALELALAPTPIAPLVTEVLAALQPLAAEKRITLEARIPPACETTLDGPRMARVLSSLVDNGIKFTPVGGQVSIRAKAEGSDVVVEVSDTGIGIAEADLPKLFTRFRQLDMSATREAGGTGLGLAISRGLVEAHGGAIHVRSRPGQGSTFSVVLPGGAEGCDP